ncbi:MAG: aminotransferase class I/II-fold pyridoxal phosphate-dependent enzyme [Candidatus Eiseniibacteriota bacterium]|nr:MAG: aminotransferase class I/II-fold pyridoxal phosphate-dependent enzyme [Candidatus Eisenbacteria bacterium]
MSDFQPFVMERTMSKFEQTVEYNLSESGVHPVPLSELLADDPDHINCLLATGLNYPHVNGLPELRDRIAALYDGARPENVLVTVGAAEANYLTVRTLLSAGDEIVVMLPNYMQIWGIAKNHGLEVRTFNLREEIGWAPDLSELSEAVTPKTKLIAVCNPNNPTGRILTEEEMDAVVAASERAGAWLLADEVYRGAERVAIEESPSFYGRYEKTVAVGSLSKAYGLPGLRIGWVVCPTPIVDEIWARHEYVAISASMLSNKLAEIALSDEVRPRLIKRTRDFIRGGYSILERWMETHGNVLSLTPPQAGAIAFVRYNLDVSSTVFTERLRKEKSVLIVPGEHFGMDKLVRISFGLPQDYLVPALDRIHELITALKS